MTPDEAKASSTSTPTSTSTSTATQQTPTGQDPNESPPKTRPITPVNRNGERLAPRPKARFDESTRFIVAHDVVDDHRKGELIRMSDLGRDANFNRLLRVGAVRIATQEERDIADGVFNPETDEWEDADGYSSGVTYVSHNEGTRPLPPRLDQVPDGLSLSGNPDPDSDSE